MVALALLWSWVFWLALASTLSGANVEGGKAPVLFWASYPVLPNETVVLAGAFSGNSDFNVRIVPVSTPSATVTLIPAQVTPDSVKVTLPASLPLDVYNVTVGGSGPLAVNSPDLWWTMGDGGNFSTPGGWIRVFGRGLSLDADYRFATQNSNRAARAAAGLAEEIADAARRHDFAEVERLSLHQAERSRQHLQHPRLANLFPPRTTTLTLTPVSVETPATPITIVAPGANLSTLSAVFPLPPTISPGEYSVSVSNGAASGTLDSFIDPSNAHVHTINVRPSATTTFPTRRFAVTDYGCRGGATSTASPRNCTAAVLAAVAAAGSAGGGEVYFDIGRWYVDGAILLPHNVLLKGAGMDLTAIYFAATNETTAPPSFIAAGSHTEEKYVRYGVEDLAIYVLSYYKNVFDISADTDGVRLRRIRVRANAFHCGDSDGERSPPWTFNGGGANPLIWTHGINFEISDCDLWSTWSVIHSSSIPDTVISGWTYLGPNTARYGIIQRNSVYNGGACHWFDGAKQIIFEGNRCVGNNPMTMGNNIDSYEGSSGTHVYIGANDISQVWGNDREVMTYDNAGTSYFGPVLNISSDGLTLTTEGGQQGMKSWKANAAGSVLVVVNGTGAGQYKRIVEAEIDPRNPIWSFTLGSPLDVAVEASGYIQVMPLRGRNIFLNNHYSDCGAFQFYGIGVDNLIYGVTMSRGGGFVNWGQWRGTFGNPNLRNQWIGNVVEEGLRAEHQGLGPNSIGFGDALQFDGHVFATYGSDDVTMNRLIVYRRNEALSNGGFLIGASTDVLLEGNTVDKTPTESVSGSPLYNVSSMAVGVLLRGNLQG